MTEEMEEDETTSAGAQYDDYSFVTEGELIELGLKDLIGELFYMHCSIIY